MTASLTEELAASAARLVAEEGLEYAEAKRKAMCRLERAHGRRAPPLPSDEQVEAELRSYIELYCADTQAVALHALRRIALQWMERLVEFRPYLAGAVWRGTATQHSSIRIDLYCDDAKSAEIALVNLGISYDLASAPRQGREPMQVLTVTSASAELGAPVTVHLIVRDFDELRGALKPDANGRSWRGDSAALRLRLSLKTGD